MVLRILTVRALHRVMQQVLEFGASSRLRQLAGSQLNACPICWSHGWALIAGMPVTDPSHGAGSASGGPSNLALRRAPGWQPAPAARSARLHAAKRKERAAAALAASPGMPVPLQTLTRRTG